MMKRLTDEEKNAVVALEQDGRIEVDWLIEAAKDPNHPLHHRFEWDDAKCGVAHRREQGREIVGLVRYEHTTKTETISAYGFVRDPRVEADEQGHISLALARANPTLGYGSLMLEILRLEAGLRRARTIAESLGMEGHVEPIAKAIGSFKAAVTAAAPPA